MEINVSTVMSAYASVMPLICGSCWREQGYFAYSSVSSILTSPSPM
jgi:hypothetical protein